MKSSLISFLTYGVLAFLAPVAGFTQDQRVPGKEKPAQEMKESTKSGKETASVKTGLHLNLAKAFQGYTLFSPLHSRKTFLIDMEGKIAHTWEGASTPAGCAYLLPNGHLLRQTLYEEKKTPFGSGGGSGGRIQEFTWDGELAWDFLVASDKRLSHHDVCKMPNGNLLILAGEMKDIQEVTAAGRKNITNIRADFLLEVKPTGRTTGEIVWEWHMWDHLIQDFDRTKAHFGEVVQHPELMDINFGPGSGKAAKGGKEGFGKGGLDWTHSNSVDYNAELDQIMISVHNISEAWIIDHGTTTAEAASHTGGRRGQGGDILYRWGNPQVYRGGTAGAQQLFVQHNAHWIPKGLPGAGHALVFNNGSNRAGGSFSSVDEFVLPLAAKGIYVLKPEAENALWTYSAPNKMDFYSGYISGAQRLPNGNTLICSGADGIFFEVTAGKEMVWKYVNPLRRGTPGFEANGGAPPKGKGGGAPTPGAVFRAYRYAPDYAGLRGRNLKGTMTVEEMLLKGVPTQE
jgi:hypothetical protein